MDLNFSNEIYESIRHLEISLAFILFQGILPFGEGISIQ